MRAKILILTILLTGCVYDDASDIKKLKDAGYSNPQITSNGSLDNVCGFPVGPARPLTAFHREFKAEKNGKEVKGVICATPFGDEIKEKQQK